MNNQIQFAAEGKQTKPKNWGVTTAWASELRMHGGSESRGCILCKINNKINEIQ